MLDPTVTTAAVHEPPAIASMASSTAATLAVYDDFSSSLTCYDASVMFDAGTVTVDWGVELVTGTIDAHGSSAQTSDLVVSGTFAAKYCR